MKDITIEELMVKKGISLSDLAKAVGVSIPLLSKIKNGDSVITQSTQRKFFEIYPEYHLVGGKDKWKEKYLSEVAKNSELEDKVLKLTQTIDALRMKLNTILATIMIDEEKFIRKPAKSRKRKSKKMEG